MTYPTDKQLKQSRTQALKELLSPTPYKRSKYIVNSWQRSVSKFIGSKFQDKKEDTNVQSQSKVKL